MLLGAVCCTVLLLSPERLPPDVQKAMDSLFFPDSYAIEFIYKSSDPTIVPDARTFYMRNAKGEELVISEVPFEPDAIRTATRSMTRGGQKLMSCDVGPLFQMGPVEPFRATWLPHSFAGACATVGSLPLVHQFRVNKPITAEQIRLVEVEERNDTTETYRIATDFKHFPDQENNSVLRFKYDTVTERIVATNIQYSERPSKWWYHLDYGPDGRIKRIRTDGAAHEKGWEITSFRTEGIPETFDWQWIGLVPGCFVWTPRGHPAAHPSARWIGNDVVLPEEYSELAAEGTVSTHPEFWRALHESTALQGGQTDLTFEKGITIFHLMYEQSKQGVAYTPWESLVREFGSAMRFTGTQSEQADKLVEKATERLRDIAKVYDPDNPERALIVLMCISQTGKGSDTNKRQFECASKARDLFLKFWDELRKEHVSRDEIRAWEARFQTVEKP